MLAYLSNGRSDTAQILDPSTLAQMMRSRFTHHPQLNGNLSGFWETTINQHDVLYHTGDTLSFSSILALLPEKNMGVFIAYNRVADAPRWHILDGIVNQCLEAGKAPPEIVPSTVPINNKPFTLSLIHISEPTRPY